MNRMIASEILKSLFFAVAVLFGICGTVCLIDGDYRTGLLYALISVLSVYGFFATIDNLQLIKVITVQRRILDGIYSSVERVDEEKGGSDEEDGV